MSMPFDRLYEYWKPLGSMSANLKIIHFYLCFHFFDVTLSLLYQATQDLQQKLFVPRALFVEQSNMNFGYLFDFEPALEPHRIRWPLQCHQGFWDKNPFTSEATSSEERLLWNSSALFLMNQVHFLCVDVSWFNRGERLQSDGVSFPRRIFFEERSSSQCEGMGTIL